MEKVSIIMPVRNNWRFTEQCLKSVVYNTEYPNYDIIIINNASTDETVEELKNLKIPIKGKIIHNTENKSFSVANNQGRMNTDADYLVMLNNDTIVTKGWLSNMLEVFHVEKDVGAVGSKLIYPGMGDIQHAGVYFMHHGVPDHLFIGFDKGDSLVSQRKYCPAVTGACLMTPADVWDRLGGLDERYKYGYEDIAYCNKLYDIGLKVMYEPSSVVYHYGSMTPGRYNWENQNFNIYMRDWIVTNRHKEINLIVKQSNDERQ